MVFLDQSSTPISLTISTKACVWKMWHSGLSEVYRFNIIKKDMSLKITYVIGKYQLILVEYIIKHYLDLTAKGDTWEWYYSNMVSGLNDFVGEQWIWKESRIGNENHPCKKSAFILAVRWMSVNGWRALNSEDDTRGKGVCWLMDGVLFKIVCIFETPI